jgi:hypothetical protein
VLRYVLSLSIVAYTRTHKLAEGGRLIISLDQILYYTVSPSSLLFDALFGLELEADSFLLEGPSLLGLLPL